MKITSRVVCSLKSSAFVLYCTLVYIELRMVSFVDFSKQAVPFTKWEINITKTNVLSFKDTILPIAYKSIQFLCVVLNIEIMKVNSCEWNFRWFDVTQNYFTSILTN